ncbi:hypothetical protein, conserved [Eimeria tenella]|uniref:Transmembrane protein n=1 Tax=Eimeria tenella TaxID=5802 RepID=U6L5D9_EIMTE|nr:hypothetical protein, conserved [Eimeria tenella]CDJ42975.1 hypothetical protein, conserved [Eimeria tenella]|eukprot:XP_013233725.1 hypothetical protein, conserved [Eimeria tenella]
MSNVFSLLGLQRRSYLHGNFLSPNCTQESSQLVDSALSERPGLLQPWQQSIPFPLRGAVFASVLVIVFLVSYCFIFSFKGILDLNAARRLASTGKRGKSEDGREDEATQNNARQMCETEMHQQLLASDPASLYPHMQELDTLSEAGEPEIKRRRMERPVASYSHGVSSIQQKPGDIVMGYTRTAVLAGNLSLPWYAQKSAAAKSIYEETSVPGQLHHVARLSPSLDGPAIYAQPPNTENDGRPCEDGAPRKKTKETIESNSEWQSTESFITSAQPPADSAERTQLAEGPRQLQKKGAPGALNADVEGLGDAYWILDIAESSQTLNNVSESLESPNPQISEAVGYGGVAHQNSVDKTSSEWQSAASQTVGAHLLIDFAQQAHAREEHEWVPETHLPDAMNADEEVPGLADWILDIAESSQTLNNHSELSESSKSQGSGVMIYDGVGQQNSFDVSSGEWQSAASQTVGAHPSTDFAQQAQAREEHEWVQEAHLPEALNADVEGLEVADWILGLAQPSQAQNNGLESLESSNPQASEAVDYDGCVGQQTSVDESSSEWQSTASQTVEAHLLMDFAQQAQVREEHEWVRETHLPDAVNVDVDVPGLADWILDIAESSQTLNNHSELPESSKSQGSEVMICDGVGQQNSCDVSSGEWQSAASQTVGAHPSTDFAQQAQAREEHEWVQEAHLPEALNADVEGLEVADWILGLAQPSQAQNNGLESLESSNPQASEAVDYDGCVGQQTSVDESSSEWQSTASQTVEAHLLMDFAQQAQAREEHEWVRETHLPDAVNVDVDVPGLADWILGLSQSSETLNNGAESLESSNPQASEAVNYDGVVGHQNSADESSSEWQSTASQTVGAYPSTDIAQQVEAREQHEWVREAHLPEALNADVEVTGLADWIVGPAQSSETLNNGSESLEYSNPQASEALDYDAGAGQQNAFDTSSIEWQPAASQTVGAHPSRESAQQAQAREEHELVQEAHLPEALNADVEGLEVADWILGLVQSSGAPNSGSASWHSSSVRISGASDCSKVVKYHKAQREDESADQGRSKQHSGYEIADTPRTGFFAAEIHLNTDSMQEAATNAACTSADSHCFDAAMDAPSAMPVQSIASRTQQSYIGYSEKPFPTHFIVQLATDGTYSTSSGMQESSQPSVTPATSANEPSEMGQLLQPFQGVQEGSHFPPDDSCAMQHYPGYPREFFRPAESQVGTSHEQATTIQLFQGVQLEKQFPAEGIRTMQQYPVYLSGVFGQPEFQVNESPLHEYVATDQVLRIMSANSAALMGTFTSSVLMGKKDIKTHPFFRLPPVAPGAVVREFSHDASLNLGRKRIFPFYALQNVKNVLKLPVLQSHHLEYLMSSAEVLVAYASRDMKRNVNDVVPSLAVESLAISLLIVDSLYAATQILGARSKSDDWWDSVINSVPHYEDPPPSVAKDRRARKNVELAQLLREMLQFYKKKSRPPPELLVPLKQCMFCTAAIPRLRRSKWTEWEQDDHQWRNSS